MTVTNHAMVELGSRSYHPNNSIFVVIKVVYQIFTPDDGTRSRLSQLLNVVQNYAATFKPDTIITLGGGSPMDAAK